MLTSAITVLTICSWFSRVNAAFIEQHVLQNKQVAMRHSVSESLKTLQNVVGDRLIEVRPPANPCFREPGIFDKTACDAVKLNNRTDTWIFEQPGGYFYGNWASCQSQGMACAIPLNHTINTPLDNTCEQGSVPAYAIDVASISDIQAAFEFARNESGRTPLVIKNTGHDWKGRSSAPGSLALWTHNFRSPQFPIMLERNFRPVSCGTDVRPEPVVLHFAGGETWGNALHFAHDNSLTLVGGTCPTVGIAGWLQGGGHSPLTPIHGMGVDNVVQVEVVTPNGEVVTANQCLNQDLFFAVRGGGGGTWGVLKNISYRAIEETPLLSITANLTNIIDEGQQSRFFEIVTSNAASWSSKGWGGYIKTKKQIELLKPASEHESTCDEMEPLLEYLKDNKQPFNITKFNSWFDYFQVNLEPHSVHLGGSSGAVASRLIPRTVFDGNRSKLAEELLALHKQNFDLWLMLVTPTNYPHTQTSALHPSWSEAIWSVRIAALWDQYCEPSAEASYGHFKDTHDGMEPLRQLTTGMGVSINEADIWEEKGELAFWGAANYQRLLDEKKKRDPENLLTNWGAVNWNPNDNRYRCYPGQK